MFSDGCRRIRPYLFLPFGRCAVYAQRASHLKPRACRSTVVPSGCLLTTSTGNRTLAAALYLLVPLAADSDTPPRTLKSTAPSESLLPAAGALSFARPARRHSHT